MMTYLDDYRNRIGQSSSDSLIDSSKKSVTKMFTSHPFYQSVMINNSPFEAIVVQSKKSEDKQMLLLPDTQIDIGSIALVSGVNYLVFDFLGEGIHDIYPTATLKRCNSTFPIQSNKTKVLKGHNEFGKPLYEETYAINKLEPCVVESKNYSFDSNDQLSLPENTILISLKYQQSDTITLNVEFDMYNTKYKIVNMDYTNIINEKGIIKITAERV